MSTSGENDEDLDVDDPQNQGDDEQGTLSRLMSDTVWLLSSPKKVLDFFLNSLSVSGLFFRSVFDVHEAAGVEDQYKIGHPARRERDMHRLLHFAWHAVVFVPVIIVCLVSVVLGADFDDVVFFGSLAAATVSLEICIGIIIQKVHHISDLSRQSARANHSVTDEEDRRNWIDYFDERQNLGSSDVAKAALVTVFSMVLFSCVVGVEALRMVEHSDKAVASKRARLAIEKEVGQSNAERQGEGEPQGQVVPPRHPSESPYRSLIYIGTTLVLATWMVGIAGTKLWIQTRHCLERAHPMDRFSSGKEALASLRQNTMVKHFVDSPNVSARQHIA